MAQRFIIKNVKFKKRPILAKSIRKTEVLRIVMFVSIRYFCRPL